MIYCPMCEADMPELLGRLGNLVHFRCCGCGIDFNMDGDEFDELVAFEEDEAA